MTNLVRLVRATPPAGRRFIFGVLLLTALTVLGSTYGWATRADRVDPAAQQASVAQPYVDLIIMVAFKPQAFHLRQLQQRGTVGAATDASIQLRRVSRADLEILARTPWISQIRLLPQ